MCKENLLHSNEYGHAATCRGCGRIQVVFNVLALNLDEYEFETLCHTIENDIKVFHNKTDPAEKLFVYNTGDTKTFMILCYNELEHIFSILAPSRLLLKANKLLQGDNKMLK
jgi:hypothetical protein